MMGMQGVLSVPDIFGDSAADILEGGIDVHAMEWRVAQSADAHEHRRAALRRGSRRDPMVLSKRYDAASPYLAQAAHRGHVFPEVVLSVCHMRGNEQVPYLNFTMKACHISTYGVRSDADADELTEEFTLNFETVVIQYQGTAETDPHEVALIL